ncbi:FkbM family methyltransferase [Marichromatium gracile]|uniref:FkbM family methyltransferase n=1 Tax=Marichromatium gracile TaxID=1048 RepID=A0A4V2W9P4_MARGR|nr:FkbM family methyltransferase [Marichromatium gracile]MBK1709318.1 hypothetical protein [Marichromatium gracile]TCW36220.1 FkbM family methyltransferase [Marichromatium gracile]
MRWDNEAVDRHIETLSPLVSEIDAAIAEHGVALYGAGFLGAWACNHLRDQGVEVRLFVDRDPEKIGRRLRGVPIIAPADPMLDDVGAVLITARHAVSAVSKGLASRGLPLCAFDGYFVCRHRERLLRVRDEYLDDARSVEVFNALMIAMLTGSRESCLAVMEKDMYFALPEFSGNFEDTFVDAGAFVGDTIERFIWENLGTFGRIYAFEPGERQFAALEKRAVRLAEEWAFEPASLELVRAGLGASSQTMSCSFVADAPLRHGLVADDDQAVLDDQAPRAEVISLDAFLDGRPATFIKADVEGMELALLEGARETIRRHRPKLALCVYHYPSDLFTIPEAVRALVPDYRLRLRQHAPLFGDFVLYCNP